MRPTPTTTVEGPSASPFSFDQDAAELVVAEHEVVRPLELDAVEAFLLERAHDGDADRERQPGEEARALLEAPAHRERDRLPPATAVHARPRRPRPAVCHSAASTAPWMSRRGARRRSSVDVESSWSTTSTCSAGGVRSNAGRSWPFSARSSSTGTCGFGAGVPGLATLAPNPVEREAHGGGVEEVGRGLQPVAEAADALEREPGGLGLPQELRNAGARQPHLRGEVFARVEIAVRQLAQQRETERSEH